MATFTIQGFTLELIDEPTLKHVVDWEMAARALRNEDAKPHLQRVMIELKKINVTENKPAVLLGVFSLVSEALEEAIKIISDNEALTLSANHGTYVKAAIRSGLIVSFTSNEKKSILAGVRDRFLKPNEMITESEVDQMKPWLVSWMAECVGRLYLEATTVPKN